MESSHPFFVEELFFEIVKHLDLQHPDSVRAVLRLGATSRRLLLWSRQSFTTLPEALRDPSVFGPNGDPTVLLRLPRLRVLDVSDNSNVPASIIRQLTALTFLNLMRQGDAPVAGEIAVQDADLARLTNLTHLDLFENSFVTIAALLPQRLPRLRQLEV